MNKESDLLLAFDTALAYALRTCSRELAGREEAIKATKKAIWGNAANLLESPTEPTHR